MHLSGRLAKMTHFLFFSVSFISVLQGVDTDGTHLINRLAQGLQVDLVVHVVLLQLKQSCLMLIVHHPPATQHS